MFADEYINEIGIENTELGREIVNWCKENIDENFKFRENQLEIIIDIINNILNTEDSKPTHIIEAPTGSGKSLILIISSCFLAEKHNLKSYILCSDLSLWKQYEELIESTDNLREKIGKLKGQSGNYECLQNKKFVNHGECRLAKISWDKLYNISNAKQLGFDCARFCKYIKDRKKALLSDVTLMTYQLYMKTVYKSHRNSFLPRDIIFCDECHNIPDIVQSTFGLTIKESIYENLYNIWNYCYNFNNVLIEDKDINTLKHEAASIACIEGELKDKFFNIFDKIKLENISNKDSYEYLKKLNNFLTKFSGIIENIKDNLSEATLNKDYVDKDRLDIFYQCEKLEKLKSSIDNYLQVFSKDNEENLKYLVKSVAEEKFVIDLFGKKSKNNYPTILSFRYALEDFLVQSYFLSSSKHQIMVSATIGGRDTFTQNCGIQSHLFDVLPSTFNFDNSPIYYLSRWKMSNAYKDKNFPKIKSAIYELCERFGDKKGIIQTHTYENAQEIYNDAPEEIQSRMLLYNGSQAKQELILYHKSTDNPTILIGPTLAEGIDLPGDECRFIIMMKMPYPYLGDNLVKAKMELFPNWYENETAKTIIQAIGRGNRYEDDWCITYILDGCFTSLYNKTKDQFPANIKKRLKFFA